MADLQFSLIPAVLNDGSDYEKAAFGLLEVTADSRLLTSGFLTDDEGRDYARGPFVSGYHLAEWLAWNWWRLRWEPRPQQGAPPLEWRLAHELTGIGEGYVWPNITIASDGFLCLVDSAPSRDPSPRPFDYIGAPNAMPAVVTVADFERAVDAFIRHTLQLLTGAGLSNSDLHKHWQDLNEERNGPEFTRFRRLEALLGFDPDEADESHIARLLGDATHLGAQALDELATGAGDSIMSARQISEVTQAAAFDISSDSAIHLAQPISVTWGDLPAWRIGAAAANALRQQVKMNGQPLDDRMLSDLAGISDTAITSDRRTDTLSWVFHPVPHQARAALRSPYPTGRRFDLARLLGDRLFSEIGFTASEPLSPATRSYSYRQKAQRAFAAELLSPWESVQAMLDNDYSYESLEQVAGYFAVSDWTVRTQIANHTGIGREYLG